MTADGRRQVGPADLERHPHWARQNGLQPLEGEWLQLFFCPQCQELRHWLIQRNERGKPCIHPVPADIRRQLRDAARQPLR